MLPRIAALLRHLEWTFDNPFHKNVDLTTKQKCIYNYIICYWRSYYYWQTAIKYIACQLKTLHNSKIAIFPRNAAMLRWTFWKSLCLKCRSNKYQNLKKIKIIVINRVIIIGTLQLNNNIQLTESWQTFCPFRKVIRYSWIFHTSASIKMSSTIHLQWMDYMKSLPCRGYLLPFYELIKLVILAKQTFKLP